MRRALWFIVKVAVLIAIAVWLADRPGTVEIAWQDSIIEMSVGVLAVGVFILMILAAIAFWLYRNAVNAPRTLQRANANAKRSRGYRALTNGMVAVAAGDNQGARKFARKADVLLNEPPLTMLLKAQAAQLAGDEATAAEHFRAMLERKETRFLGLRGLIVQALKRGDRVEALRLAREARALRPDTEWVLVTCLELETESGQWQSAQRSLNEAVKHRAIAADRGVALRAALLLERAREAAREQRWSEAVDLAHEAGKLRRGWLPAAITEAGALIALDRSRAAEKVVEKAWTVTPHRALVALHDELSGDLPPIDRAKRREKLGALAPDHPESLIAMAEGALDAELWGLARRYLSRAIAKAPCRRAYRLMAEVALAETGDVAASRDWLAKADGARGAGR
ncbi:MAG: heme biosynthesis HemY N-terminal domain-containing protein, partial [Azospirillaceae bacterium]